jgi:hypothetical protein
MNKSEALYVIHEILVALKDSATVDGFSLDSPSPKNSELNENFRVNIRCDLDDNSRKLIQPVLDKRNLKIDVLKKIL